VLIKPDGEELDRINGFDGAEEFVGSVKDYLAGNNLFSTLLAEAESSPDDVAANFAMGKKYLSRWEDDKAYPYFSRTIELDPDDTLGHNTEASLRIALFKVFSNENPDPEPLKQFIADNSDQEFMFESYSALARYYQYEEKIDRVMPLWEELLAKMPDSPLVMTEYGYNVFSLKDESRYEKAKSLAEKALATGDEDILFSGHYNIIRYYRLKNDNETALAKYAEAAQNVPTEPFFRYGYAAVALQEKMADHHDRGIEMIREAIELNSGSAAYWDTLAGLSFEKGRSEDAVEAMEKALELRPDNKAYQEKLEKYRGEGKK
jgi:tetratricopeptide (TPR) repeat protein